MSPPSQASTIQVLGLPFFNGSVDDAVRITLKGGLVQAPSGPGLAVIDREPEYYQSLRESDLLLVDSGFLAMQWKRRTGQSLQRISGLQFLKALLAAPDLPPAEEQLWVMPSEDDASANRDYLADMGIQLPTRCEYLAPHYPAGGDIQDDALLKKIQRQRPRLVILNIAGGKQEILGAYLKRSLDYLPGIVCTGAAIAFLTGRQASIPSWVDRARLGWLQRILFNPERYLPRYLLARRLSKLLERYGKDGPYDEVFSQSADKA